MLSRAAILASLATATLAASAADDTADHAKRLLSGVNIFPEIKACVLPEGKKCGDETCVTLTLEKRESTTNDSEGAAAARRLDEQNIVDVVKAKLKEIFGDIEVDLSLVGAWDGTFSGKFDVTYPEDVSQKVLAVLGDQLPLFDIFSALDEQNSQCANEAAKFLLQPNLGNLVLRKCVEEAGVPQLKDTPLKTSCADAFEEENDESTSVTDATAVNLDWYSVEWHHVDSGYAPLLAPAVALTLVNLL